MLKKIKYKLFPIRYSTLREYFFWLIAGPFVMEWVAIILTKNFGFDDLYLTTIFFVVNFWALYCGSYKPIQWLFKKKGKKYEGRIIRAEIMYGVGGDTFYFFIEFKKGDKTLIRRTVGYQGNPYMYLENDRCSVYEYMGKFIEVDFNVRKKFPQKTDINFHLPITKHKLFMPRGNKYV